MPPRPLWNGTLSFGLVTVPVRLYPAIAEHKLQFHLIHEPDESPIGYQKICKLEDKPVPDEEIVKAFEIRKGELVHLTDEDFEAARAGGGHSMDITDFVPYADIDPILFAHAYYVGARRGRRPRLRTAGAGDGGLGPGGSGQVRAARPPAPRRPSRRRRPHRPRAAPLRR